MPMCTEGRCVHKLTELALAGALQLRIQLMPTLADGPGRSSSAFEL